MRKRGGSVRLLLTTSADEREKRRNRKRRVRKRGIQPTSADEREREVAREEEGERGESEKERSPVRLLLTT